MSLSLVRGVVKRLGERREGREVFTSGGRFLPDKPGIGEWLDAINSQLATCRILLTSRPWLQGSRAYPPICMQEYSVLGLDTTEGISLLRKQGVEATQANYADLQLAVARCAGHALALTLLASILRSNRSLSLNLLFNDPMYASLWTGNIAGSLLDYIYTHQLGKAQRKLLQAFSVYREPVPLNAAQALVPEVPTRTSSLLLTSC